MGYGALMSTPVDLTPDADRRCKDCDSPDVIFGPHPYLHEIYGDDTPVWLCRSCRRAWYLET